MLLSQSNGLDQLLQCRSWSNISYWCSTPTTNPKERYGEVHHVQGIINLLFTHILNPFFWLDLIDSLSSFVYVPCVSSMNL